MDPELCFVSVSDIISFQDQVNNILTEAQTDLLHQAILVMIAPTKHDNKGSSNGEDDDPSTTEEATSEPSTSASRAIIKEEQHDGVSADERNEEDDLQKLEARRAYNRKCAANARKRSKELVVGLQAQVLQLTRDKNELQRANDIMRAQVELLESQNRNLMMGQSTVGNSMMMQPQGAGYASFLGMMPQAGMNNTQQLSLLARQMQQQQGMHMQPGPSMETQQLQPSMDGQQLQ